MQEFGARMARAVSIAVLIALAGCQSAGRLGESTGENRTGAAYMAKIRADNALPSMSPDSTLEKAARQQAALMAGAGKMSHTTSFGQNFGRRMHSNGVKGPAAENIAHGAFGPEELFARWMASPPHRRNMLDPSFTKYGLAAAQDSPGSSRRYWALVLAK
ncbi:CAP domain-containing protein [Arvimicrobium flavum]|uniref:CAP domain-containing protein n=1 Tax=Arvimicrobium flavum TaxID=3393320 RepID=UPI00237C398F|nr:CAP domain-containing protein [Mesorhizobium shangrilense]